MVTSKTKWLVNKERKGKLISDLCVKTLSRCKPAMHTQMLKLCKKKKQKNQIAERHNNPLNKRSHVNPLTPRSD